MPAEAGENTYIEQSVVQRGRVRERKRKEEDAVKEKVIKTRQAGTR